MKDNRWLRMALSSSEDRKYDLLSFLDVTDIHEKINSYEELLKKAEELSDHLLALINDILDMSRIEAGKVELEKKSFSLHKLGKKLYDMFARNLEAEGIHYEVNYEDMSVDYVIGDELRISQIIMN